MDKFIVKIVPILKKYRVKKASLFGSVVRREMNKKSDIDILIDPPRGTTLFDLVGIKNELEAVLNKPVDLVTYGSLNSLLKTQILKEQKVFYEEK